MPRIDEGRHRMPGSSWRRFAGRFGSTTLPGSNPPSTIGLSPYLQHRLQSNKNRRSTVYRNVSFTRRTGLGKAIERVLAVCSEVLALIQNQSGCKIRRGAGALPVL